MFTVSCLDVCFLVTSDFVYFLTCPALQMQVTRITVNQSYTKAELKCDSSCSPDSALSYVWFKNGQKVPEETSSYIGQLYPGDNISCALKGHEGFRSPPLCEFTSLS